MTDTTVAEQAMTNPSDRRGHGRKRKYGPINLEKPPTDDELNQSPHQGEAADRFSLFTPAQIDDETKTVRIDMTFKDAMKVRDQAEMIISCMQEIIKKTREHRLGSIRQRIEARREADSLRRVIARFNGKCPHGDRYIPKSQR